MQSVEKIIEEFILELRRKYGEATCDLHLSEDGHGRAVLSGKMLTQKQWAELDKRLKSSTQEIHWQVEIIADQPTAPLGWAHVDRAPTNVWSRILLEDHLSWLSTQVTIKEEPIKLLWQAKGFYCVQLIDQTIGWIREMEITLIPDFPSWQPPEQKAANRKDFIAYIERWLGVPYLRGGMTLQGIDCSGLVQNIYRHHFNYLLPRHSMDQMKEGKDVVIPRAGDIAFFEHHNPKTNHTIGHAGIVIDPEKELIVHASKEMNQKVAINTLKEMLQGGYTFLAYRTYPVELI